MELWTGVLSGWKCHWPDLKVLASSDGISSWVPLKPQDSIPCWLSIQWGPRACRLCQCYQKKGSSKFVGRFALSGLLGSGRASILPLGTLSLGYSNRSSFHRMAFFPRLKQNFIAYRSSKVQIAFLKFTSCNNQTLVGCIPIPAVAVHLNLKS